VFTKDAFKNYVLFKMGYTFPFPLEYIWYVHKTLATLSFLGTKLANIHLVGPYTN